MGRLMDRIGQTPILVTCAASPSPSARASRKMLADLSTRLGALAQTPVTTQPTVILPPSAVSMPSLVSSPAVIYRAPGETGDPLTRGLAAASARPRPRSQQAPLRGRLSIDTSIQDWSAFARHLEAATGYVCRMDDHGRRYEPLEIDGSTAQVLEALKLMGKLDYRIEESGNPPASRIHVDVLSGLGRAG